MIATMLIPQHPGLLLPLPWPLLLGGVALAAFALFAPWYWFAAAAAVSVYANLMQSRAAAEAQRQAARVSRLQGDIAVMQAEFQARQALKAGHEQATHIRRQSTRLVGSQVVRTAGSGVELSGSPMAVIAEEIWAGERAAATTLKNAIAQRNQIEAAGYARQVEADANAAALRTQANVTEQAGWLRAISSAMNAYAGYQAASGGAATPNYWTGQGYTGPHNSAYNSPGTSY